MFACLFVSMLVCLVIYVCDVFVCLGVCVLCVSVFAYVCVCLRVG